MPILSPFFIAQDFRPFPDLFGSESPPIVTFLGGVADFYQDYLIATFEALFPLLVALLVLAVAVWSYRAIARLFSRGG